MKVFTNEELLGIFGDYLAEARRALGTIDLRSLPSIAIDKPKFASGLPVISAVYFIFCFITDKQPLYIGKAVNLRSRWRPSFMAGEHRMLQQSLELDAILRWLEVPRRQLTVAETLLIQIYSPEWNSQETSKMANLPPMPRGYKYTSDDYREMGI